MPIKKAGHKALRQSYKRRTKNLSVTNNIKSLRKKAIKAIAAGQKDTAKELVTKTNKALDKAAQKKVIKKNTVARLKSRLVKKLSALK